MSLWYHNGKPVATAGIDDRAFQYGDGLFETVAIRSGEPRLWDLHVERLATGCARLGIELPDADGLREELMTAVDRSNENAACCVAKIIVSSGVSRRGYGRETAQQGETYFGVFAARPLEQSAYEHGVDAMLCNTRLAVGSPVAGLKTLNRLEQVLGRSEVLANGAFEGLMLDAEQRLICGTMSNVFIVSEESVKTASLVRCGVEGVMRRFAIDVLCAEGLDVDVGDIGTAELTASDEIFLTNSQFGLVPVRRCDATRWPIGPVTRRCMALLAGRGIAECRA